MEEQTNIGANGVASFMGIPCRRLKALAERAEPNLSVKYFVHFSARFSKDTL